MPAIFDAHCHIIDPAYPLQANNGFLPEPFRVSDYLAQVEPLGVRGGAVVSGSFQGFDQTYLLAALKRLGANFVGVTQLPSSVTDAELEMLNASGVRALRFNLKRGGSEQLD
ncbi:amidohydrolase family protein, partial [Pseudomonas viridiflava]